MNEKHPSTSYPAAKHPNHSKLRVSRIKEKPVSFLVATDWDGTFTPAKTLLIEVPLQKFSFL